MSWTAGDIIIFLYTFPDSDIIRKRMTLITRLDMFTPTDISEPSLRQLQCGWFVVQLDIVNVSLRLADQQNVNQIMKLLHLYGHSEGVDNEMNGFTLAFLKLLLSRITFEQPNSTRNIVTKSLGLISTWRFH